VLYPQLSYISLLLTRRPWLRSQSRRLLFGATPVVSGIVIAIPYTPLAAFLGLVPLPALYMVLLVGGISLYILESELAKQILWTQIETLNNAPMAAVAAIARAPQNVMRKTARPTGAPPMDADSPPRDAKKNNDKIETTHGIEWIGVT
jgi:hypothetical protein